MSVMSSRRRTCPLDRRRCERGDSGEWWRISCRFYTPVS